MSQLPDFATRYAVTSTTLEALGIKANAAQDQIGESVQAAALFCSSVMVKTAQQAAYDQLTNLPCGIFARPSYKPVQAFKTALTGAIGTHLEWDVSAALELCADILDDVNAHEEAAKVRAMIDADGGGL